MLFVIHSQCCCFKSKPTLPRLPLRNTLHSSKASQTPARSLSRNSQTSAPCTTSLGNSSILTTTLNVLSLECKTPDVSSVQETSHPPPPLSQYHIKMTRISRTQEATHNATVIYGESPRVSCCLYSSRDGEWLLPGKEGHLHPLWCLWSSSAVNGLVSKRLLYRQTGPVFAVPLVVGGSGKLPDVTARNNWCLLCGMYCPSSLLLPCCVFQLSY